MHRDTIPPVRAFCRRPEESADSQAGVSGGPAGKLPFGPKTRPFYTGGSPNGFPPPTSVFLQPGQNISEPPVFSPGRAGKRSTAEPNQEVYYATRSSLRYGGGQRVSAGKTHLSGKGVLFLHGDVHGKISAEPGKVHQTYR